METVSERSALSDTPFVYLENNVKGGFSLFALGFLLIENHDSLAFILALQSYFYIFNIDLMFTVKKKFYRIIAAIFLACLFFSTSCENKWPDNGDFDGMWQLLVIDDGTEHDMKSQKVYWSVRTNLIQFNEGKPNTVRYFSHLNKAGSMLEVYDICYDSENASEEDNNEWISFDKRGVLFPYGIDAIEDSQRPGRLHQIFTIETLTSKSLVLKTEKYTLRFRKF